MLYNNILTNTGLKGNRSTPLQKANFAVLRDTNMPAALIECGFMDSTTDTPIILTETFAQQVADGITKTVCELYGIEYGQEEEEVTRYKFGTIFQTTQSQPLQNWKRRALYRAEVTVC